MSSSEAGRRPPRALAAIALAAQLAGCARPAGEFEIPYRFGEALDASFAIQEDRAGTGTRLNRDFAASAETTVTFAFDDARLDDGARAILDRQAVWLLAHPEVPMVITGYADLVGSERYNYGLGLRRAQSARDYLMAQGVLPARLVAIESRGDRDPVVPVAGPERLNRRAVTAVAGRAGGVGPGLDGTYAARTYDAYQAGRVGVSEAESMTVQ
jgi:outer membrane protein OmpA-like peptidoglycan-associated protein